MSGHRFTLAGGFASSVFGNIPIAQQNSLFLGLLSEIQTLISISNPSIMPAFRCRTGPKHPNY